MRGNINRHIKDVHHKVGYPCLIPGCGHSYTASSSLKGHEKVHLKEPPRQPPPASSPPPSILKRINGYFTCPYNGCNQTSVWRESIKRHIRNVHHKVRYPCRIPGCGHSYTDPSSVRSHIATVHHDEPPRQPTTTSSPPPSHPKKLMVFMDVPMMAAKENIVGFTIVEII